MLSNSFLTESIESLAHATLIIRASQEDQAAFIAHLGVPVGDTVAIDALESGGIKDIHGFTQKVLLSPQFGSIRLGVIYNADNLTPEAQNALLKLLEEPPTRVKLILFVGTEATILQTILSRCRRYFGVKESMATQPKQGKGDILTRFNATEELAKQEDLMVIMENELAHAYSEWRNENYGSAKLESITKQLELYLQLNTQTSKRLLLERFVVSSL